MEVYVRCCRNKDGRLTLPITDAILLFVCRCCHADSIQFHLVTADTAKGGLVFDSAILGRVLHDFVASVPECLDRCCLPAIVSGRLVHAGLCSVLRCIIKHEHRQRPQDHLDSLLGHRGVSLKACAEVSPWTHYCEIELPTAVDQLRKWRSNDMSPTLIKLENHLRQPPAVANRNKLRRRRHPPSRPTQGGSTVIAAQNVATQDENKNLSLLGEHVFAEGPDLTVTDLVLFPCLSCLISQWAGRLDVLQERIPRVAAWYRRMLTVAAVQEALVAAGIAQQEISGATQQLVSDELETTRVDNESLYIRDTTKKKIKVNSACISNILEKVSTAIFEISHLPDDIRLDWQQLPTALHPSEGELPWKRVEKKCQQLESLVSAVQQIAKPGDVIVDFCSGGGHLGMLLAYLLPDCQVVLVENKEESILRAYRRINILQQANVLLYQCNLTYLQGHFDIGVCLHACGTAADLVLQRCLDNRASFVVTPCCYGAIRRTHSLNYPRSGLFKKAGILYEDYLMLSHAADQTEFNITKSEQGKLCMLALDSDRLCEAKHAGYSVKLCKLSPETCSPKNHLLFGVAPKGN